MTLSIRFLSPAARAIQFLPLFLLAVGCTDGGAEQAPAAAAARPAGVVAFVDVDVIPMDQERVIEGRTVIVRDGRISAIGAAEETAVPEGAIRVDGAGRFLMPGLAEMHGHIPSDPQYAEDALFLYVANGVTLVRGMAGHPSHLDLRDRVARGELTGPTIFAAGPAFGGGNAATAAAAEALAREHHAAGYDLLKVSSPSVQGYEALARTAHELGIPFGGHIPAEVGITGALAARQSSVDHLDRYVEWLARNGDIADRNPGFFGSGVVDQVDVAGIPEIVEATRDAGVWNVPTLSLVENLARPDSPETMIQAPEMRFMPQSVRDDWVRAKRSYAQRADFQPAAAQRLVEVRRELTRALHEAGAPLALGSDAPQFFNVPGFSVHSEMAMMAAAGLTPYEVLVTGTRNPAVYFETPEEFGTVEVGRRADFILLDANPLQDITNTRRIAGVMVRGTWLPREEIDRRLQEIAARAAAQ